MATRRLIALAAVLLLAGCANRNVHTMSFASMAEATRAGAVERGWVPAWLPADAYELRAAYDLDGWRRWGILNFRAESAEDLRGLLDPGDVGFAGVEMDIPARIEWWPVALRGRLDDERVASTGLRAYRLRVGGFTVAVNWNQGRAYYWATKP